MKRARDIFIVLVLLAAPFLVLSATLRDPRRRTRFDAAVLQTTGLIQTAATKTARAVSEPLGRVAYLFEVADENDRLRGENARLLAERQVLEAESQENRRLRSLLQLRERLRGEVIAAEVIGRDVSPFFRVLRVRLDHGARDRVQPGMPVLAGAGLAGEIQQVAGRYSDVLLTVDRRAAVDVIIQRTGARGMLRGSGEAERYLSRIQYLGREDEIRVGDLVHTSGLGQRFPPSILVGRVTRIVRQDFGLFQEVEVTPAVDFSSLEEVLILTEGARGESATEEDDARPAPRPTTP